MFLLVNRTKSVFQVTESNFLWLYLTTEKLMGGLKVLVTLHIEIPGQVQIRNDLEEEEVFLRSIHE